MEYLKIFVTLCLIAVCTGLKFNKPRILLPLFNEIRVNYTLEVLEKGCFNFRVSSGQDFIQIQPIYESENDCTHKIIITAISRKKAKSTILAESRDTGEILRCDVILAFINTFGVHTTTRELYLEEAPETFELKAQDSAGNSFTSLAGIEFSWKIGTQNRNTKDQSGQSRHQVLRFLTFSESKYHQVPKELEKFETVGKKGYMILLDGINSGSAKVIVKLPQSEYKHVPEIEVDITVLANLIIDPMEASILIGDTVNFKVFQLKQGQLYEIVLGAQYYLEIENIDYAKINGGLATGIALGITEIILRDRNVIESNSVKTPMPRARLSVAEAEKIVLNLLPYYNWVTVETEKHEIAIDLYTKNDERIMLGSKFKMELTFDQKLFLESSRNTNRSRIQGEAVNAGTNPVSGSFLNLVANAEMLIYGKIKLQPRRVILPYDVNKPVKQKIQFNASGGDGSFTFSTLNPTILTITQTGLSESHLDRVKDANFEASRPNTMIGTTVKAAMSRNTKIFKTAEVLFMPPVKLQIVGYNLETPLNDYLDVNVGLFGFYDNEFVPFTACENLQFEVEFSNQIFSIVNLDSVADKPSSACKFIKLKAIHIGSSSLTISYRHGSDILKDDIQLLVYEKIIVVNPESNVVVLPIGSSRNIIYQYGPRKAYNVGSDLIKNLQYTTELIDVSEVQADYQEQRFAYNILCRKVGDTKLRLEIYNELVHDNFMKHSSVIETIVNCVKPRFINLLSLDKMKTSCPIDSKSSLLHVRSMQDALDIEIEVLDHQKRKLQNITSLFIDFMFSQANGVINHKIAYSREVDCDDLDGVLLPKRDFVRTSITDINVSHKIKATVKSYDDDVLKSFLIEPESPVFGITKSAGSQVLITPTIENELDFLSYDSLLLPINSISIFLAPGLPQRIRLGQGSGYYDITVKHPSLLEVRLDKSSSELVLIPKQIGETFVEIVDRCLKTDPSKLHVAIVAVKRVELSSPDRVEVSKTIEAIVKLYDSNNQHVNIDFSNIDAYRMSEKIFAENILSVKLGSQENLQRGEIRYIITGNGLGETKIIVSSDAVSSSPAQIQVFSPLQLIPRNATILVGSILEVSSRGGPKPDSNIVYQVENSDVVAMEGSVLEGLKVGKTTVVGRSVGINPINGNSITYSEDLIYITVVPLSKVKIRIPLQRLKSGNVMPVTLWAEPEISPMVLGTLKNLKIRWQTDAPDVIELRGAFENLGVVYGETDAIALRVRGLKQGKGRITATVYLSNMKLQATADISIFKTIELESPKRIVHDPIILRKRTRLQLKVNLDETVFEINEQTDSSVINVTRDGMIQAFEILGTCLVVATNNDQKLDIPVEVKNINYIMASIVPNVQMKSLEQHLPRDLTFLISISIHDNLGNKFSLGFEEIKWKLSNRNAVEVRPGDNFTLSIGLLHEGSNVLAISLRDSTGIKYPEDYVKLSVRTLTGILNKKLLVTLGDLVCFSSPLSNGFPWYSFNPDVLFLQGSIGRVTTLCNQEVEVRNGDNSGIYMNYVIDVRYPDKIQFKKNFDIFNGETYRGFFIISNYQQVNKQSNLIASNLTQCADIQENFPIEFVQCKLSSHENESIIRKFETSPIFDKNLGMYACEIRARASLEEITSFSRSKAINFQLEASLASGISDKTELKLTPAVQIFPRLFTIDKLQQQEVTVTGMENILQRVEVISSHPENLVIHPLPKQSGKIQFKSTLHNAGAVDSELFIQVTSPLTQQVVKIPIVPPNHTEAFEKTSDWVIDYTSNFGRFIAVCVVVLSLVAMILVYQRNRELDTSGVFQSQRSMQHSNQTLINNNNSNVFAASPLQNQRTNSSPIKLSLASSQHLPDSPIYGDPTIPSPLRRYHKRTL